MSIEYKYTIAAVNAEARCMEVIYEAVGHETMRVGTRLPFDGEALEDVIRAFSPVTLWEERAKQVQVPVVGESGLIAPVVVQAAYIEIPKVVL